MKNWKLIAAFAVALTGTAMPAHAELDLSANFGIMSDYIYRGFHQSDAVANGGIDLAAGPFYLGTWLADLDSGSGVEIDVYGGLAWEFENGFSAYVGYTAYRYTEDDDGVLEPHVVNEGETDSQTAWSPIREQVISAIQETALQQRTHTKKMGSTILL